MKGQTITIAAPNLQTALFTIRGTAPLVQNRFSEKAKAMIRQTQAEGSTARGKKKREPKDFDALYRGSMHQAKEGWYGIHAGAFRNAMISACRTVGFAMTKAKLAVFIEADGFDKDDGTPLVRISGEPRMHEGMVRNATGVVDLRVRGMFEEWQAQLKVRFDADMLSLSDVANLLARVGMQVGIGEGRPDSKDSGGMGWGTFEILGEAV